MAFLDDLFGNMGPLGTPASSQDIAGAFSGMAPTANVPKSPAGMFGLRGTPRDILGVIGDALLVQSRNSPIYRPQIQREQQGAAMEAFLANPTLEGIQEMAQRNPEAAWEMYQGYLSNQNEQAELGIKRQEAGLKRRDSDLDYQLNTDKLGQNTANVLSDMYASVQKNPDAWPMMRDQMIKYAQARGYTPPAELPTVYDPDFDIRRWGMDSTDEATVEATQARLEDADASRLVRVVEGALDRQDRQERDLTPTPRAPNPRRNLSPAEVAKRGYPKGTVVQVDQDGAETVTYRPSEASGRGGSNKPPRPPRSVNETATGPDGRKWKAVKVGNTLTWQ